MAWTKTPNVAQFKGADWTNFVHKESNCTPETAKRIALKNPQITFFFFCRNYMVLEGPVFDKYGAFHPGDAVFFSGAPWFGSAPQCDSYQKNKITVAYIDNCTPQNFLKAGYYYMADGSSSIDVACIFAANLNINLPPGAVRLAPNTSVPPGYPILCASDAIANQTLPIVKQLQDKGITVLLSVLGNHDAAGWSNFATEDTARNFAQQLQEVVNKYGLDGIDIDDEYSYPDNRIPTSLVMVTSLMQGLMPGKIISKALYGDLPTPGFPGYFSQKWGGKTLADTLTYGWEMTYGGLPGNRLPPYVQAGMVKSNLSLGFWSGSPSGNPDQYVQWLKANGYGGVMVYAFEDSRNSELMGTLVNSLYGPGNWNYRPNV